MAVSKRKTHAVQSSVGKRRASTKRACPDAKLDLALANTFPASDPVAVGGSTGTEPPSRPVDRQSPIIDAHEA
jgi:hypothetical protein